MAADVRTGGCLCGRVRYNLDGDSNKPFYNTICHCLNCRRSSGTAFYSALICPKDGFTIVQGEDITKGYQDTNTDSGKPLSRIFCSNCGSKLFAFTPLREDIVSVAAGTLDDFESWKPDTEQWCIHRAEFLHKVKGVDEQRVFDKAVKQK